MLKKEKEKSSKQGLKKDEYQGKYLKNKIMYCKLVIILFIEFRKKE